MRHRERFLYNLRTEGHKYLICKYNEEMEVVSKYNMVPFGLNGEHISCDCPQGAKPTCRHRKMFPMMLERVDTGWFFDYDNTGQWFDPFGTETPKDLDEVGPQAHSTVQQPASLEMGSPPPRDEVRISRRSFK